MALTIVNNLITIIDCDVAAGWSGSDASIGLDNDIFYEPTGSIAHDLDIETYYATYTWGADQDFTDLCVYWWYLNLMAVNLDTWANGGVGLRLEDDLGNWSEWWVAGKDTYKGGWKRFVVYSGSTPDDQSATAPVMTKMMKMGNLLNKMLWKEEEYDNYQRIWFFVDYSWLRYL